MSKRLVTKAECEYLPTGSIIEIYWNFYSADKSATKYFIRKDKSDKWVTNDTNKSLSGPESDGWNHAPIYLLSTSPHSSDFFGQSTNII